MCCREAANTDGDPLEKINVIDLTRLIEYLFRSHRLVEPCGVSLTWQQRAVVFNNVDSVITANSGLVPDSLAKVLSSFLSSRPEIEATGIDGGVSVWGRFTDNRLLMIPNNREPTGSGTSSSSGVQQVIDSTPPEGFVLPKRRFSQWDFASPQIVNSRSSAGTAYELPKTIQARVINTLSPFCHSIGTAKAKTLLENGGYVVTSTDGTVPGLLTADGDGVFYIDAHCGGGESQEGLIIKAIWTSTLVTQGGDSAYASMLSAHELVYMLQKDMDPIDGICSSHLRYAFTGAFVAQYMTFADHSLILINACESDHASLRSGFLAAGASVYAGWNLPVTDGAANRASEFLLDRMLGANVSTLTPVEAPKQRPFDIDRLWLDMTTRNFDFDMITGSQLATTPLQDDFELLSPSIKFLSVVEEGDSLLVSGMFGTDPGAYGRVIVGGSEIPIIRWTDTLITANIPNTGAGSVGPVRVEVDGVTGPTSTTKRRSNEVNLTEWRGDLTHTLIPAGTMTGTITIHTHIRADLHPFREEPHAAPYNPVVLFDAAQDSYGSATATGTYTLNYSPEIYSTYTWSGTAYMPGMWEVSEDSRLWMYGSIDPVTKQMMLSLTGSTLWTMVENHTSNAFPAYTEDFNLDIISLMMDDPYQSKIYLTLTSAFDIPAGQRNDATLLTRYNPFSPASLELKWNLIQSSFPPDTSAAQ